MLYDFLIQAIAFSAASLALMFGAIQWLSLAALAAIPVILLLMIVCRIGIYKYSTANRNLGYELHLGRLRSIYLATLPHATIEEQEQKKARYEFLKKARWEEVQRAWRIIQPMIFRKIYRTPEIYPLHGPNWLQPFNHLRTSLYQFTDGAKTIINNFKNNNQNGDEYPWFCPKLLTRFKMPQSQSPNTDAKEKQEPQVIESYHAGTYLQNLMDILVLMQYLLLAPMGIVIYERAFVEPSLTLWLWLFIFFMLVVIIKLRSSRMRRRRQILENELLSIHSCSIIWHAVVITHFLALQSTKHHYIHYTEKLAKTGHDIADSAFSLHTWIEINEGTLGA